MIAPYNEARSHGESHSRPPKFPHGSRPFTFARMNFKNRKDEHEQMGDRRTDADSELRNGDGAEGAEVGGEGATSRLRY